VSRDRKNCSYDHGAAKKAASRAFLSFDGRSMDFRAVVLSLSLSLSFSLSPSFSFRDRDRFLTHSHFPSPASGARTSHATPVFVGAVHRCHCDRARARGTHVSANCHELNATKDSCADRAERRCGEWRAVEADEWRIYVSQRAASPMFRRSRGPHSEHVRFELFVEPFSRSGSHDRASLGETVSSQNSHHHSVGVVGCHLASLS